MNRLKKAMAMALAVLIVLSFAACGSASNTISQTSSSTVAATADSNSQATGTATLPVSKDKITLKFVCYNWGDAAYGNDMPVFQELEKRTNIHLDWQLLPAEDNLTKLNLIEASGELPDIISFSDDTAGKKTFDKYAADGAIIPLDDLISQYAPNIKSFFENPPYDIPNLKAESKAADGKIYSLPSVTQIHTGEIFSIRQDWLDKIGAKAPETTDDLFNVLKAFKDQNLSGDGNTIPFCPDNGLMDLTILMNAFGAHENYYVDPEDNTIKYGPLEDQYKQGLEYANKLYMAGLIDKDYINANNSEAFRAKISKNEVGMMYAWPLSGLGFGNTAVAKLDPGYKYVAMLPVKGPNGDRYKERPQSVMTPRTVITSANKHQEETIKYLDYVFSKDGNILMNYGIQDKDYTLDSNGNPQFTDYVLKNPDGKDAATVRTSEGMQVGLPYIATYDCESQTATDSAIKDAWKLYTDGNVLWPGFPNVSLDQTQIGDISGKITDIKTYVDENSNKFVMGKTSLADYSKFTDTIKQMGIDDVLKVYNDAYKKYAEFNK